MFASTIICQPRALALALTLGFAAMGAMSYPATAETTGQDGAIAPVTRDKSADKAAPTALGPKMILEIGSIDFHPIRDANYSYVTPGGVTMATGSEYLNAGLPLPVGAKIIRVIVFVNPNGSALSANVTRYNPLGPTFENLGNGGSTAGNAPESFKIPVGAIVQKGWNYRISNLNISAGTVLYGARVIYRLPK